MSIEIRDLSVRYGEHAAVSGLSLSVPTGSMFGLLGPNGAGKSSTIRCIATIQRPQGGSIVVGGLDVAARPDEVRRLLGVVPQGLALYEGLRVGENLRIFGALYGLRGARLAERVEWGLDLAQLGPHRHKRAGELSGGMKRRLNIAAALLHDPQILIFDEPTTGVDPQSRNHIFETIRALHAGGRTVVYTTHYMEEATALCDRVAIIDHGRVIACDALDVLLARAAPRAFRLALATPHEAEALRERLVAAGLPLEDLRPEGQSLEAVFLQVTGRALRDGA